MRISISGLRTTFISLSLTKLAGTNIAGTAGVTNLRGRGEILWEHGGNGDKFCDAEWVKDNSLLDM